MPTIDAQRMLQDFNALAQIGRSEDGALQRVAYSLADIAGRVWVREQMHELGMETRIDAAGNTIGVYAGTRQLPALALGSHSDSVPFGGSYDGALGIIAALACVRALHTADLRLTHPVELINFAAEEATMAGGTTGSQAMAGLFDPALFNKPAWDGRPVREHVEAAQLDVATFASARREAGCLAAYLELHIEQGQILQHQQARIGIVQGFVGIRRYEIIVEGQTNHAGTTPMETRQDALVKAAPLVGLLRALALEHGIVGTVGSFEIFPGAPNVIPGRVKLIAEIRSLESATLDSVEQILREHVQNEGALFDPLICKPPVQADAQLIEAVRTACEQRGVAYHCMPSGAGHDAMNMATLGPQTMLFVPSVGGISHSPEEYTTPQDCVLGAEILLASLLRLEETL